VYHRYLQQLVSNGLITTNNHVYQTCQNEQDTLQDFTDKIESRFQAFKLLGGDLCPSVLVDAEKAIIQPDGYYLTTKEANGRVEEKLLAMLTIEGAMDAKYSSLKRMLANQMVQGVIIRFFA